MEFSQLKAFISVAQNHSFSITAKQLNLTQPAISKRISTLEEQLDCTLFDRVGHQVQLTEGGRSLLPRAIKILHDIEDCSRHIQNLDSKIAGKLTIASSHHIALHRLPEILKSYSKLYQEVELDFRFLESEQACEAVRSGTIELAVITLPLDTDDKLYTHKLWEDPLCCMVSKEHTIFSMPDITLEDLTTFPIILPKKQTYTSQIIERTFINKGLQLETLMTTNELESIRMMVEIGLGWSILPRSMLREPLAEISISGLDLTRTLGIVRHKERTLSNAAKSMIETLEATKGGVPPQHP